MRNLFLTALFLLLSLTGAGAHPHMALFSSCEFEFSGTNLKGVWIEFEFDKFFSYDIRGAYDIDQDGVFDSKETEAVYNNAFINLKNYGYFISIREGNNRRAPERVTDFSVFVGNDVLHYRFFVPLQHPASRELFIAVYDPTFFCRCYYNEEKPIRFINADDLNPEFTVTENRDFPVFYSPTAPASDLTTYDKWEPGLQTYYPEEVHLVF